MYHLDESAHHLLAGREVGNNAVAQRADSADIVVRFLIHHLCLLTHGNHLVGTTVKGYDRRFVNHNLIITDNDGVGRTKVHCYLLDKTKESHFNLLFDNLQFTICNLLGKPAVDGGVVVRADAEGTGGEHAALILSGLGALLVQNVQQHTVLCLGRHDDDVVEVLGCSTNQ